MASMVGIAYLVASACLVLREPSFFVDATNFTFAMISGVAFPVAVLPWFVKPVAYLLPTTYAVDLLRVYALGTHPLLDPALKWVALAILSVALIVVGRVIFWRTEHRMRVRGTLGQH
jgi:ABC-2 type transport system permease protein